MEILSYIVFILAVCFIFHGAVSLRSFFRTLKLINNKFPLYSKKNLRFNKKAPYIFTLLPVLKEEKTIISFLENISNLNYDAKMHKVLIVSTEKEYYYYKSSKKKLRRTTIEIIDEYLAKKKLANFKRIHYPYIHGYKTDQLNYAVNFLKKEYPREFLNKALFCIFDVDSFVHKDTFKLLANYLKNGVFYVIQQPNLWFKNFNILPHNFNGYFMRAFALFQSYYAIYYEIPMINREYKFPYQMKYCMGNGLFIKGEILEKLNGFPPLIEDTRVGHICSFLKINIRLLPIFGITEVANRFTSLIKQISVWFVGESFIFQDLHLSRLIQKQFNWPYVVFILAYKIFKNLWWMNEGLLFIIGLGISLFLKSWLIIFLYCLILVIKVWLPVLFLLAKSNRLLGPYNFQIELINIKPKIILLLISVLVFCFSFFGPYLGILRLIKSYFTKKTIILPKTQR